MSKLSYFAVYGEKSFLSKESDTLRSYRVYISPTKKASSALIQIECHPISLTYLTGLTCCATLSTLCS